MSQAEFLVDCDEAEFRFVFALFWSAQVGLACLSRGFVALHHFHQARFEDPTYVSDGEALEALWSGFEAMFDVPQAPPEGKAKALVDALFEELEQAGQQHEVPLSIPRRRFELFVERLYLLRNQHTHGQFVRGHDRYITDLDRDMYGLGLALAEVTWLLRIWGDNLFSFADNWDRLHRLFAGPEVRNAVLELRNFCWRPVKWCTKLLRGDGVREHPPARLSVLVSD